jgi:hypothetical protein
LNGKISIAIALSPFAIEAGIAGSYWAMANPEAVIFAGETAMPVLNDLINPSLPPETVPGQLYFIYKQLGN